MNDKRPDRAEITRRFQEILKRVIGNGSLSPYAALLERSESGIRNWLDGVGAPHPKHIDEVVRKLGVDSGLLYVGDRFEGLVREIPNGMKPPNTDVYPKGLFTTDQIADHISHSTIEDRGRPESLIVLSPGMIDLFHRSKMRESLRAANSYGTHIFFVIPNDFSRKNQLANVVKHPSHPGPKVVIVTTKLGASDVQWSGIESVILCVNFPFVLTAFSIKALREECVSLAFEQIYVSGDTFPIGYDLLPAHELASGKPLWITASNRRIAYLVKLLDALTIDAEID